MIRKRRSVSVLTVIVFGVLMTGCAVIDKDNRRTLNLLNEQISSEEPSVQLAILPVQTVALVADIVVVNPVASIPKAAVYTVPEHVESIPGAEDWSQKSMAVAGLFFVPVEFLCWWTMFALLPVEDIIAF